MAVSFRRLSNSGFFKKNHSYFGKKSLAQIQVSLLRRLFKCYLFQRYELKRVNPQRAATSSPEKDSLIKEVTFSLVESSTLLPLIGLREMGLSESYLELIQQNDTQVYEARLHEDSFTSHFVGMCLIATNLTRVWHDTFFLPRAHEGYVFNVYTVPNFRNLKIARRLVDYAINNCITRLDLTHFSAFIEIDNEQSKRLFSSLGFLSKEQYLVCPWRNTVVGGKERESC
jgi:ribosomal protein S18 acetylase RimI-like enzyme